MTWAAFKAIVLTELGPDGRRRGIEALRTRAMRDCAIDLQRFIRAYRQGQQTTYEEADLTEVGYAHLGTLGAQAKPKAFYIVSTGDIVTEGETDNPNIVRNRLDFVPWDDRRERMIDARYEPLKYLYTISPFSRQFLVHPLVNDETYLLLVWDGMKNDFEDGDTVPWPEWASGAFSAWVKYRILLEIDKRIDLAREQYDVARKTGIYPTLRLALYREQQESQSADGKDEEYSGDVVTPPTGANLQSSWVALDIGDTTKAIVFPTAYDALPIVDCWVVLPDGSAAGFDAWPDLVTITTTGFTANLAASVPATGYRLYWRASAAS